MLETVYSFNIKTTIKKGNSLVEELNAPLKLNKIHRYLS